MTRQKGRLKHGRFSKQARSKDFNLPRALTIADFETQLIRVYNGEPLDIPLARLSRHFPNFKAKCDFCLLNNTHPKISK